MQECRATAVRHHQPPARRPAQNPTLGQEVRGQRAPQATREVAPTLRPVRARTGQRAPATPQPVDIDPELQEGRRVARGRAHTSQNSLFSAFVSPQWTHLHMTTLSGAGTIQGVRPGRPLLLASEPMRVSFDSRTADPEATLRSYY